MRVEIVLEEHDIKAIALQVVDLLGPRLAALEAAVTKVIASGNAKARSEHGPSLSAITRASEEMLNLADVRRMTGLSESSIWRHEKEKGTFPRRRQLSARRVAWSKTEVLAWIEARQVI